MVARGGQGGVIILKLLMELICRMVSFGVEDFARRYGALKPSQFVDVVALAGDKSDNIPGVEGIGDIGAVKLITKFGSLENLLQSVDQVEEERIKQVQVEEDIDRMEIVGENNKFAEQKSHHRCRRRKHDWRMTAPLR